MSDPKWVEFTSIVEAPGGRSPKFARLTIEAVDDLGITGTCTVEGRIGDVAIPRTTEKGRTGGGFGVNLGVLAGAAGLSAAE